MKRLLVMCFLVGQFMLPPPGRCEWVRYDNNADIRAFFQNGDTLWIGTNGGVVLVDLLTETIARKITAGPLLPGNSVRAIEGRADSVFVGTDQGLSIFGIGRPFVRTPRDAAVFDQIRSISFGPQGKVYLGTFGLGVGILHGDTLRRLTKVDSLLDDKVYAVAPLDSGDVFYATSLGLCAYRDSLWVGFQAGAGLPRGEVKTLIHIGDQRFYTLIAGRGIYRFKDGRSVRIRLRDAFRDNEVAAITVAPDGLWAAGRYGGIARYRNGTWTQYGADDEEVARGRWRSAYAAPGGVVYFGSADGLVVIVKEGAVRKLAIPSILASGYAGPIAQGGDGRRYVVNGSYVLTSQGDSPGFTVDTEVGSIFAMAVSPAGLVWACTPWGLLRNDGGRWAEIHPEIEPQPPIFVSLTFDPAGMAWLGGHHGEVYRYDGRIWVRYASGLSAGPIQRVAVDAARNVWAVTRTEGVFRFDGREWERFDPALFDSMGVSDAVLNPIGELMLVTSNAIWRYTNSEWSTVRIPGVESVGDYRALYFDEAGRLYLGTDRGLAVVSGEGTRWYGSRDGLGGRDVTSLLVDREGALWVGFLRDGISRISLENLW
ncbi:MAG: hypothetical protein ACE5EO_06415 [Candidatus Krumholzibacteriia bacterium]